MRNYLLLRKNFTNQAVIVLPTICYFFTVQVVVVRSCAILGCKRLHSKTNALAIALVTCNLKTKSLATSVQLLSCKSFVLFSCCKVMLYQPCATCSQGFKIVSAGTLSIIYSVLVWENKKMHKTGW